MTIAALNLTCTAITTRSRRLLQLMEEMFDDALLIERDAYIDFMPDDERARLMTWLKSC